MNILWIVQSRWNVDVSVYGNILVSFKGAIVWNKRLQVDTNYICLGDNKERVCGCVTSKSLLIIYIYLFILCISFCPVSMWVTFVCSYTLTAGSLPAFFSAFLVWSSRHHFLLIFLWWSVWPIGAHFGLGWEISFHYKKLFERWF